MIWHRLWTALPVGAHQNWNCVAQLSSVDRMVHADKGNPLWPLTPLQRVLLPVSLPETAQVWPSGIKKVGFGPTTQQPGPNVSGHDRGRGMAG